MRDSFGIGYDAKLENSFTEQMRKNFEVVLGKKVEVINLSVSGFGTAEQLLILQNEAVKYHPDLVLLTWHTTDPDDNARLALFEINDGKLVRKNQEYLPGVKVREFLFRFKIYRWLAGNSHFYNWVRQKVASTIKNVMVSLHTPKAKQPDDKQRVQKLEANKLLGDPLSYALIKQVDREAKQVGANFLILEIPTRRSRTEFRTSVPENIRNDFDVVSPIDEFRKRHGSLLYWERSHGHFTPLGCKIVGRLLAEEIIKQNYGFR